MFFLMATNAQIENVTLIIEIEFLNLDMVHVSSIERQIFPALLTMMVRSCENIPASYLIGSDNLLDALAANPEMGRTLCIGGSMLPHHNRFPVN